MSETREIDVSVLKKYPNLIIKITLMKVMYDWNWILKTQHSNKGAQNTSFFSILIYEYTHNDFTRILFSAYRYNYRVENPNSKKKLCRKKTSVVWYGKSPRRDKSSHFVCVSIEISGYCVLLPRHVSSLSKAIPVECTPIRKCTSNRVLKVVPA